MNGGRKKFSTERGGYREAERRSEDEDGRRIVRTGGVERRVIRGVGDNSKIKDTKQ